MLLLCAMVLVGAAYTADLALFTNLDTGFVVKGSVWVRYAAVLLPLGLGILGLRSVGPRSIGVMRLPHRAIAALFVLAAVGGAAGAVYGAIHALQPLSVVGLALALLWVWYTVWMALAALQLYRQNVPSPTQSAFWGMLAVLPFCVLTVVRVFVNPASLYRIGPVVRIFSALFCMLWLAMLIRSLYIAMVRSRVRWMYLFGLYTFLFCTCLELPQTLLTSFARPVEIAQWVYTINLALVGLIAAGVSLAIAGLGKTPNAPKTIETLPKSAVRAKLAPVPAQAGQRPRRHNAKNTAAKTPGTGDVCRGQNSGGYVYRRGQGTNGDEGQK